VPPNSSGLVYIPATSPDRVIETGLRSTKARLAQGVQFLRMEDGAAVFRVDSGHYRFLSEATSPSPAAP
jgi:alpha-L-rhamnosidase